MAEIISIEIIDNDMGGHRDLLFSIPDLVEDRAFDTYYFALAAEKTEEPDDIEKAVAQLIQFWIDKAMEMKNDEIIYLPIDFSDQYTGCLRVYKQGEQLVLTYGYSMVEGFSINPLNPEDYYKDITDFKATSKKQISVDHSIFVSALNEQKRQLCCKK